MSFPSVIKTERTLQTFVPGQQLLQLWHLQKTGGMQHLLSQFDTDIEIKSLSAMCPPLVLLTHPKS